MSQVGIIAIPSPAKTASRMRSDPSVLRNGSNDIFLVVPSLSLRAHVGVVSKRGYVSENTKSEFLDQGYTEIQVMEVIVGVALKIVSNYIDHLNPVEIDPGFKAEA